MQGQIAMALLFINPSLRRSSQKKLFPLGLASVLTYVKQKGYGFDLLGVGLYNHGDEYVESFFKRSTIVRVFYYSLLY